MYQKGDKPKVGDPIDLGLSSQSRVSGGTATKLRDETSLATQRPVAKTESVKSDRGTFKNKC